MEGFVDIHTHLLPGVDDGAADMSAACELVRMAWQNGTDTILLTPHYRGKYRENTVAWLRENYDLLCRTVAQELPEMKLHLGMEVHYETETPDKLLAGRVLTLNDSQYVLLEFRSSALRSQITMGVSEVVRCGLTPIIAHAERYDIFLSDPTLADEVLYMGALLQLNADSVMGAHGFFVKRFCHKLLKAQKVHFIASDAHDQKIRPPMLRDCYCRVSKKYGQEYAWAVFRENARAVLENRTL